MNTRTILLAALCLAGCGESEEASSYQRQLRVDPSAARTVTTDLGYRVTLTRCTSVVRDLQFTRGATAQARGPLSWIIGTAIAHPGHGAGGEIRGELPGRYVVDWLSADALGQATFLEGAYEGLSFTLAVGLTDDGLAADDPLVGATHVLEGVAEKDGESYPFSVALLAEEGALVEEVPFSVEVGEPVAAYALQFTLEDPFEADTALDGIDFASADFSVDAPDYNRAQRALRSHDHYFAKETTP